MKESFERVGEHLYKRQYQSAKGQWKTIFYAIFTDWKGIRRKVPLGGKLPQPRAQIVQRIGS
jgi:hypothetical protein